MTRDGICSIDEHGPLEQINLAELLDDPYRMEDVVEEGKVVETTMIRSTRSARRMNPGVEYSPTWRFTWYATLARCQQAVQQRKDAAKALQRRYQ
jgi:hypothetical protein